MGFQIGGSSTDLVMLVMTERGADELLSSQFTLGAEGSVAAGPVGRTGHGSNGCANARGWICWSPQKALSSVCVLLEDAIPH